MIAPGVRSNRPDSQRSSPCGSRKLGIGRRPLPMPPRAGPTGNPDGNAVLSVSAAVTGLLRHCVRGEPEPTPAPACSGASDGTPSDGSRPVRSAASVHASAWNAVHSARQRGDNASRSPTAPPPYAEGSRAARRAAGCTSRRAAGRAGAWATGPGPGPARPVPAQPGSARVNRHGPNHTKRPAAAAARRRWPPRQRAAHGGCAVAQLRRRRPAGGLR